MVAVNSTMQALGSVAPDFNLPNTNNNNTLLSRERLIGKPLLIMFICNHCPFVIHIMQCLVEISNAAQNNGFEVIAISSNDIEKYPQDGPEAMRDLARQYGIKFAYLFDESQSIAKAYGAACTPDFFIYDSQHRLQYRGQMDSSRPNNNIQVTGDDLQKALDAVANNKAVADDQIPSIGCSIKWKTGNAPEYF